MSLEECPACQKAISIKARSCPNCGEPLGAGWDVKVVRRRLKKSAWKAAKILLFVFVIIPVGITLFQSDHKEPEVIGQKSVTASIEPRLKSPQPIEPQVNAMPSPDTGEKALHDMTHAFIGNPSGDDIRVYLDRALVSYGEPLGELSYRRAGSALVVMRKETGVSEMDLLRCIVGANAGEYGTFAEMAAVCATILAK